MEESGSFSQSPFTTNASPSSQSTGGGGGKAKKIIFLVIILLILGGIAYGATVLLGGSGESTDQDVTPTEEFFIPTDEPTPTEDPEATPTEKDEDVTPTPTSKANPTPTKAASSDSVDSATGLDRADLSIVVQNGSGEAGVAGVMSDKLKALGYNVTGTANADNFDYAQTTIQVKSADKAFLALLKKDLSDDYTVGTATSDYTGSGDAVVIVGKE